MNFDLVHVAAEQMICACAMHIKTGEGWAIIRMRIWKEGLKP